MSKNSKRKMTINERLYSIGDSISGSFTLQFLIEGTGELDIVSLKQNLILLSEKLPVLTLKLKGRTWSFEGKPPRIFVHDSDPPKDWNDALFRRKLDAESGNCSEIHVFQGESRSLLFRVLHSAMDAKGAQLVLRSLFALMRGESINPDSRFSSDSQTRKFLEDKKTIRKDGYELKWPGFSTQSENKYQTVCLYLDYKLEAPLAKIACWHAQQFQQTCRMMIPVDLRRHEQVSDTASNLSLPIYLKVEPEQNWQEVQAALLSALSKNEELIRDQFEFLGTLLPTSLFRKVIKSLIRTTQHKGLFPISGILSNNGFIDLPSFSTSGFIATQVISLPVFVPLIPFCVNVVQHADKTQLAMNIPFGMDLEELKKSLETFLLPEINMESSIKKGLPMEEADFEAVKMIWAEVLECSLADIDAEVKFHDLGGDSLKLLAMLSDLAGDFNLMPESAFINAALNTGGDLNISGLLEIMHSYRTVHP